MSCSPEASFTGKITARTFHMVWSHHSCRTSEPLSSRNVKSPNLWPWISLLVGQNASPEWYSPCHRADSALSTKLPYKDGVSGLIRFAPFSIHEVLTRFSYRLNIMPNAEVNHIRCVWGVTSTLSCGFYLGKQLNEPKKKKSRSGKDSPVRKIHNIAELFHHRFSYLRAGCSLSTWP